MALTSNRGVDMVVEMLANANLGKDLTMLADGGVCAGVHPVFVVVAVLGCGRCA